MIAPFPIEYGRASRKTPPSKIWPIWTRRKYFPKIQRSDIFVCGNICQVGVHFPTQIYHLHINAHAKIPANGNSRFPSSYNFLINISDENRGEKRNKIETAGFFSIITLLNLSLLSACRIIKIFPSIVKQNKTKTVM